MAEDILYADLNLPESTKSRILKVTDVQGCTYAEMKVKPQDTNAATVKPQDTNAATNCKSFDKRCCSRRRVAVLVAVLIVAVVVIALSLILPYGRISEQGSETTIPEEAVGCAPQWEKHGRKCYFFSLERNHKDWNGSREECSAMGSDLVIIDSREELDHLIKRSGNNYYLLGLYKREQKWKWINNVEHDPAMFQIKGTEHRDYLCTVIGDGKVATAPCGGTPTTQNLCEKATTASARLQKDS